MDFESVSILPANTATAVYGNNLSRHVVGIAHEKDDAVRDVARVSRPLERDLIQDVFLDVVRHSFLGPQNCARRNTVHAHLGRHVFGKRKRQHGQAGLGRRIDSVVL